MRNVNRKDVNRKVILEITYDAREATKQGIINVAAECSGAIRKVKEIKPPEKILERQEKYENIVISDTPDVCPRCGFITSNLKFQSDLILLSPTQPQQLREPNLSKTKEWSCPVMNCETVIKRKQLRGPDEGAFPDDFDYTIMEDDGSFLLRIINHLAHDMRPKIVATPGGA